MPRHEDGAAWNEAQRRSDIAAADWFILAAGHRLQQTSSELAFHSYAISQFEDSFALQLTMLQQHVRATPMRRRRGAPDHESLVERIQIMLTINRHLDRAGRRLEELARTLAQLAEAVQQEAGEPQPEPQVN